MKKFKQLAALFLAFAMVIGVFSKPTVALAALTATSLTDSDITIDYVNERIDVASTETVYYATKWTETTHATTNWDESYTLDANHQTIDFSTTSASKDATFYITDDTDKSPIKVTVKAQETTLAVAFSGTADTTVKSKIKVATNWASVSSLLNGYSSTTSDPWAYGYLNVTIGKGDLAKALTKAEVNTYLQFRKGTTGDWQSISALDVRKFTAYGAQLYFRIKPTNTTTVTSGSAITTLGRASKEVKVTYTKQANAPKVSITGDTKQIKLSKNQEYRTFTTSGGNRTYTDWVKVADEHVTGTTVDKVYLKDLVVAASGAAWNYNANNAGQGVQVRVAATDKAIASKVQTIELNKATTPSVGSGSAIELTLVKNTTFEKGITVKNTTTGSAIQVAVASGTAFDVNNTKEVKWVTVLPGKSAVLAGTALAAGDRIIYRAATIKDDSKTSANEFVVSSDYGTYLKSSFTLATQTFTLDSATPKATVTTVSPSAVITGNSPYTVTVTNTASASAITVSIAVTTTNVVAGTPVITCVSAANDSATTATATKVKLLADGAFQATSGKLKITIAADASAETKIFRVTLDGKKTYVTVDFKSN
jgi:hypothetical protein